MSNFKKKKFESFRVKLKVEAINYQKDEFGIYRCSPIDSSKEIKLNWKNEFNVKGNIPYDLRVGKVYTIYMGNPEYNEKFKNHTYEIDKFEVEQLTKPEEQFEFLQTVTTANLYKQFVEHYDGQNIIDLIFNDQIDFNKIKGLQQATFDNLKDKLEMYKDLGKLQILLAPLGVTVKAITKIANHFDSPDRAHRILTESLYNLCEVKGYGFTKVDEIALKANYPERDPIRISECLKYIIDENTKDGHSWSYREDIKSEALEYLNIEPHLIDEILNNAPYEKGKYYKPNDIIVVGELVSLHRLYMDEHSTLMNLIRIRDNYVPPVLEDIDELIEEVELKLGIKYSDEQVSSIKESFHHGVYVINGAGGTGKTFLVRAIVEILNKMGRSYMGCAISGKASKVLSSKGVEASTIHRMLKYDGNGFMHTEDNPLPYHTIILDEASMTNANLWNSVTTAIMSGSQLLVLGDDFQLPCIGAGNVLRDLLNTKLFKRRELTQIHRQAQDSGVIEVANKFRREENITGYNRELTETYGKNEDLTIITRSKPKKSEVFISEWMNEEEIKEAQNPIYQLAKEIAKSQVDKILKSENPKQEIMDFQVISPNKTAGALSVDSMNALIQRAYNKSKVSIKLGKTTFIEGDKVLKNGNLYREYGFASVTDYKLGKMIMHEVTEEAVIVDEDGNEFKEEKEVVKLKEFDLFNGTIGIIEHVDIENEVILVAFEDIDGLICLNDEQCESLDLGYAISIHKSQGSSIPNVLMVLDYASFKMLSGQLVYTGITRTSKRCIFVAENNALFTALQNNSSSDRRTFMSLFLQQLENK